MEFRVPSCGSDSFVYYVRTCHGLEMDSTIWENTGLLDYSWAMKMLRARAHADEAGGDLSQNWKPFQQTKHERN